VCRRSPDTPAAVTQGSPASRTAARRSPEPAHPDDEGPTGRLVAEPGAKPANGPPVTGPLICQTIQLLQQCHSPHSDKGANLQSEKVDP
jgi:hypothetical protein